MTTYEQELIGRLTTEEIKIWVEKNGIEIENLEKWMNDCTGLKIINKNNEKLRFISSEEIISLFDKKLHLISSLARELDKPIIELCYEIKPITTERLNKITIEQWKQWAEKYNFQFIEREIPVTYFKPPSNNMRSVYYIYNGCDEICIFPTIDEHGKWAMLLEIARIYLLNKMKDKYKPFDFLEQTKAIHDLIWELENL